MTKDRLFRANRRHIAGLLASTLLLALYARVQFAWPLGFVALVPWLLVLDAVRSARGVAVSGVLMSMAFVVAVFSWFGPAIGAYTDIGAWTASAALLLMAPLLQPQLIAFALVRHLVGRRYGPGMRALAAASAWVACEAWVPKLLGDTLGHGIHPSAALRQVADLGGAAGITFLLLLVNEAAALAVHWRGEPRRALRPVMGGLAIVAGMAAYGLVRLAALQAPPAIAPATLRIAMIQASITDYERLRREMGTYAVVRHVLDTHYALSVSAIRDHGADALLWSETVYPTTFGNPRSADGAALDREIRDFVETMRVPLVFGTYDVDANGEYNAAAFLEPGQRRLGTYRKTHPFPLTEYVPRWLDGPLLRRLMPWAGTWQPGDGARVLPIRTGDGREVNVVPLICLDDVRTGVAIDGARLGAQAIIGMSNDSWFSQRPIGARLHLAVAAFRSIETRLPQVRVTTNGLSAIIDDTGQVVASTGIGQQAVLTAFVKAQAPPATLMVRWGDWTGRAATGLLLGLALIAIWRRLPMRVPAPDGALIEMDVAVLSPAWRWITVALRLCVAGGLVWLATDMALHTGWQVQSVSQLWRFGVVVVAPAAAAAAILHACKARLRIVDGVLLMDQARRRIEVPLASIIGLIPWRLPLPLSGVDMSLASGRCWNRSIALRRPQALRRALQAGTPLRPATRMDTWLADHADARGACWRPRLDHGLVKFGLFPLLPALVAFRLHQVIAFGGMFGEYYTFGPRAWFTGLLIWWASWSMGLMLYAAGLRVVIELACGVAQVLNAARSLVVRDVLEWMGRLLFYLGVPAWLALRLLQP